MTENLSALWFLNKMTSFSFSLINCKRERKSTEELASKAKVMKGTNLSRVHLTKCNKHYSQWFKLLMFTKLKIGCRREIKRWDLLLIL